MHRVILTVFLVLFAGSVQAQSTSPLHESPLLERPWPKGEKVPCRCDILAMPYELCLKGIGREECFKPTKPIIEPEPKCSNNVKPGTVIQTFPPIFNCEDLKRRKSLEQRIKELEERLKLLEDNKE